MPEDNVTNIMSSLGLDLTPAITSIRQFSAEVERLNSTIGKMRLSVADIAKGINTDIGSQLAGMAAQNKIIYDQYGQVLKKVDNNTAQLAKSTKTATQVAKEHTQTVQNMTQQYSVFQSQMQRRLSWFVSGGLFYGAINTMRQIVSAAGDVEMGMTEIGRVMEDSSFRVEKMRKSLLDLGVEYGTSWKDVQDIALRWAQAGYNMADTLKLTRDSLLAYNTAELDARYATEGFIAILSQWGMSSDQLLPTIDKINKVADDYAVTSQDLVDGLNRSSGAAKLLGLSLEETIAILTVMREATGRTGKIFLAPYSSNAIRKNAVNSGEVQRWITLSQAA